MSAQTIAPMRPATIVAKVVRVENVFDDPGGLLETLNRRAPFNLIYGKAGYEKSGGAEPWFREHWISEGVVKVPEAEPYFHNEKLIGRASCRERV